MSTGSSSRSFNTDVNWFPNCHHDSTKESCVLYVELSRFFLQLMECFEMFRATIIQTYLSSIWFPTQRLLPTWREMSWPIVILLPAIKCRRESARIVGAIEVFNAFSKVFTISNFFTRWQEGISSACRSRFKLHPMYIDKDLQILWTDIGFFNFSYAEKHLLWQNRRKTLCIRKMFIIMNWY